MRKKFIVGLTGGIGSGKSTVGKMLQGLGACVIDADGIAHQVLRFKTPEYTKAVRLFGEGILKRDSTIDRARLARHVFAQKKLLQKLNALTHPRILKTIKDRIRRCSKRIVVLDAPLLFETGLHNITECVVVVSADVATQVERVQAKSSLTKAEIIKRIKFQMPLRKKLRKADFVIDNNGSLTKTRLQVSRLWKQIRAMQGGSGGKTRYQ